MKLKTLALLALALALVASRSPAEPAADTRKDPGTLKIVVVEALIRGESRIDDYVRMEQVFTDVFGERKWPLKVAVERFASNTPDDGTQLRIFYKGIYPEGPDDLVFHAWMILTVDGVKHDFGMVNFRYIPRPSQSEDLILEHVVRGAAVIAADKVEGVLFPKKGGAKP